MLDIDYTLFDLNSSAEHPDELARPYLHEFLAACHEYYDIIIWSATNMKWVEVRAAETGPLLMATCCCVMVWFQVAGSNTAVCCNATGSHACVYIRYVRNTQLW